MIAAAPELAGLDATQREALREVLAAAAQTFKPREMLTTCEWAERHRFLEPGTTDKPGRWSNEYFPYLRSVQDCVDEALATGKRGVVLMKSGQGGGSEAMINALARCLDMYGGPALWMIAKDELARTFARERFDPLIRHAETLRARHLAGRGSGSLVHVKRFMDAKIVLAGGRSVLNLQALPYQWVFVDEYDSLQDEMDGSDPLKLAEIRTDAFAGRTLIVAFAHPSTRARGAGRLYYDKSDMRRAVMPCFHCGQEMYFDWQRDVKAHPEDGMTPAQAERDPRCYRYFAPCCGAELSDGQRWEMARRAVQKSTLKPEEAARRPFIGVHFSQLYMANKTLAFLAEHWIEGLDDEPARRVFFNKRLGEVFDAAVKETSEAGWRQLIAVPRAKDDPECWVCGQVPAGVSFLTAGQDSRSKELHYCVWGWGWVRDKGGFACFCGWLIDYGVFERQYSMTLDAGELRVFDQILYERLFLSTDGRTRYTVAQGLHDSGWQPIAVYDFCLRGDGRAAPCKGDAEGSDSARPTLRWAAGARRRLGMVEEVDNRVRLALLNTYRLKESFFGLVEKRFDARDGRRRARLNLPADVGGAWLAQSCSEYLALEGKQQVWKHKGPNHYSDCNIYAYAAALELSRVQPDLPFDQAQLEREAGTGRMRRAPEGRPWIHEVPDDWLLRDRR